jgi:glycosyltransferase involved in cell wall biosynthesis
MSAGEVEIMRHATEPLVSIIVPFYEVQEFLGECLETILDQDYRNIEVVLVDDRSPDGSRAIAEAFVVADPRVRLISHERNQGLGPARNTGARHARGEYLFFLDSDDYLLHADVISRLMNAAIESNCDITVGSSTKVLSDRSYLADDHHFDRASKNQNGEVICGTEAFIAGLQLSGPNYLPTRAWGMLIKGHFYRALALDFPAGEHEDLAHTPFLYFAANGVRYVRGPFIAYRVRTGSISNGRWTAPMIDRYFKLWHWMDENLERFGLQRYRSNTALKLVHHLFWKLKTNGFDPACTQAALSAARMITREAGALEPDEFWFSIVEWGRSMFISDRHDFAKYVMFADAIPAGVLLAYYRSQLASAPQSPD